MNEQELKDRIDKIIKMGAGDLAALDAGDLDVEGSHIAEDDLLWALVNAWAPDWAQAELKRLRDVPMERWYA